MDHGEEVLGQLIVAGSDPSEVLQLGEEALDQVLLAVEPCAEVGFRPPVSLGRDVRERALFAESRPDTVDIVCLVCEHDCSATNMVKQIVSGLPIMALSSGKAQPDWEALRVDNRVDFGREAASGTTETMISIPLFAIAACWWARTDEVVPVFWTGC